MEKSTNREEFNQKLQGFITENAQLYAPPIISIGLIDAAAALMLHRHDHMKEMAVRAFIERLELNAKNNETIN